MQYVTLVDSFGGLNTYMAPDKVGPGGAVDSIGVDVSDGSLRVRTGDSIQTLTSGVWQEYDTYVPATSKTIVPWGVGALGMAERYAVASYGGRLYRSHKGLGAFPSTLNGIQYTSNIGGGATPTLPTWDFFGLFQPGEPAFSVTSTATGTGTKLPAGTYTYYCTFYNDAGQESSPASVTYTLSTTNYILVTLPKAYTKCTTVGGSPTLTNVADIGRIRPGQRITGSNIPANSYVIGVNTSTSTATLSNNVSGSGTTNNVLIWDAQVVGTRVYRLVDGEPLLVQQTALGTADFTDNKQNNELGEALKTIGTADIPSYLSDVCVSPSGVLICIKDYKDIIYMSPLTRRIYDPTKLIRTNAFPLTTIYALQRFIIPTTRGALSLTIDDAILGIPIIDSIDDTEPSGVSYEVYAVDVGNAVWWNTGKGIVQTNGTTIDTVTKYTFNRNIASYFKQCYGAEFFNNEYYAILQDGASSRSLYKYSQQNGWSKITSIKNSDCAIGFHVNYSSLVYTGNYHDASSSVRLLYYAQSPSINEIYAYKTGDWAGDKMSALKKFRKISAIYSGTILIYVYVDGIYTYALSGTNSSPNRTSWWLPSGVKGRTIALDIRLNSSNAVVEELGVWVGEQREPMP